MINLFEDVTKNEIPTVEIEYDITEKTSNPVTAKLVNASTDITITNNEGRNTYTFTENGQFVFEFVDKYGNKGTAAAVVSWITLKENDTQKPNEDNNQKPEEDNNQETSEDNNQKTEEYNTQKSEEDNTIAKGILPHTGVDYRIIINVIVIFVVIILILIKIIFWIRRK